MPTRTNILGLLLMQEDWKFGDESFNRFIEDADDKLVGVAHLVSKGHWSTWQEDTVYNVGDVIRISNTKTHQYYQCITSGVSGSVEPTNNVTNSVVTDGTVRWIVKSLTDESSASAIKIWLSGDTYARGDVVLYGTALYRCKTPHTATSWTTNYTYWTEIFSSIRMWRPSIYYFVDDTVIHNKVLWQCITAHTSDTTFSSSEEANWEELSPTINEITTWAVSTDYAIGQLVIHNNKLYRCNTAHTSDSSSFNTDIAYWDEIGSGGIESWKANELYQQGNTVVYNDKIYICDTAHTSTSTFDPTKWHEISSNDIDNWQTSTSYNVGDMVVKDGQLYRCITQHTSDSSDFSNDIANWQTLDTKWKAVNWTASTLYIAGEVVLYNNTPIKCTTTHVSDTTYELDKNNWETLSANIREWVSGTTYKVGDTVMYENQLYTCTVANNDVAFERAKWKQVNKCNIEIWHGASDTNILALLHFDDINDLYYNEYGSLFTGNPKFAQTSALFPGCNYSLDVGGHGDMISPTYSFTTGNEVYTLEYWFRNEDHWNMFDQRILMPFFDGYSATARTDSLCIIKDPQGNQIGTFNEWQIIHIAQVITGTESTLYLNGTSLGTITRTTANADIQIRIADGSNVYYKATLDELRISNIARYTSNFTPKREIFPSPNYDGYKYNDLVVYEDKIYRAIVDNNDIQFDKSKWVEVSPCVGIEEWASGSDYTSGTVILYNNNLYKVVNDVTGAIDTPDNSNDYVLLGGDSIKTWVGSREYSAGTVVLHQNRLYRNANDISSSVTTFSRDDWTPLFPVLEDWTSSKEYKVGDFVIRNDILYECTIDNNDVTFNSAKWKPISKEGINAWQSSTQYALYDLVVEDEDLYMCISPHTSSSDFQTDLDAERWKLIGGGGGSSEDWNQVTKMNVVAPLDVDINIPYTNTFKRPPVEVLKYEQGTTDITTNVLNFGVGDGSKFEIDGVTASESPLITFDGVAKPNHDILYPFGTPTQMVDKYYSESEEIDLDDFKVVGEVSLECEA